MFLYIDLPRFDFPVIFSETVSTDIVVVCIARKLTTSTKDSSNVTSASTAITPVPPATTSVSSSLASDTHLWSIVDPDIAKENPVEDKHRRLVRSHRSSPYDRELKPNAKIRDELNVRGSPTPTAIRVLETDRYSQEILNYAPSQPLTSEEKDLIWKFRFYLTRDKRGLTKFLKSVTWRDPSEVKQAVEELLPQWTEIDVDDALELLGPNTVDSRVRAYAVKQLSRADDDVSHSCPVRAAAHANKSCRSYCYICCSLYRPSSLKARPATNGPHGRLRAQSHMMTAVWRTSS